MKGHKEEMPDAPECTCLVEVDYVATVEKNGVKKWLHEIRGTYSNGG